MISMKLIYQSFLLLLSFGFVFVWQQTPLSGYTIQILGFLIFLYLIVSFRKKGSKGFAPRGESWTIFILNTVVLLLIISTGGFTSTLFFLLYFLVFGIAFVFEPPTVFVFVVGAIIFFVQDALKDDVMRNLIMLGSLGLISPLAFFFGREYRKEEVQDEKINKLEQKTEQASNKIAKDVDEVLRKDDLKLESVEKLNNILEQTEKLREQQK